MTTVEAVKAALAGVRRQDEETALTDRCDIYRSTVTASASGGRKPDTKRVAHDVPCRVRLPRQQREAEAGGQRPVAQADMEIDLPSGTDVRQKDHLHVGADRFEVIGTDSGRSDALRLTCKCVRVG